MASNPQMDARERLIAAILAIAPTERPRDVYDFPDDCYDAYREGQESILWTLADMLRKTQARLAQPPGEG